MATFVLDDIRDDVKASFQDDANFITADELDRLIQMGVRQVSRDYPLRTKVDLTGDATKDLALPSDFDRAFSDVPEVEFPVDEIPPVLKFSTSEDFIVYFNPAKTAGNRFRLLMLTFKPATGDNVRVTITRPWSLTNDSSTSNVDNERARSAIVLKASVFALRALASKFNQATRPVIDADTTDFVARAQDVLFLAERLEGDYKRMIGGGEDVPPAQAFGEKDVVFEHGEDFLFRDRRRR